MANPIVMNTFEYATGPVYLLAPALADPAQTAWKLVYNDPQALGSTCAIFNPGSASVQNGGIKPAVLKAILQQTQANTPELNLRKLVANAAADSARATWKEDVRRRKLTVATGQGTVHGHKYNLEDWGLSGEFAAAELAPAQAAAAAA
jgi:hypothetical protein